LKETMIIFHRKPKDFINCWGQWQSRIRDNNLLLFSDFDGTLAPIVERPQLAELSPETKSLLQLLADNNSISLTIVTGRALADIRQKIGIKKIMYIATHGFEIEGVNVHFRNPLFPKTAKIYCEIEKELRAVFQDIPGVIFEDKGMVLAVHYRMVPEGKKDFVRKAVQKQARPYVRLREVSLREGKAVIEIRPAIAWDKGKAVLWLLRAGKKVAAPKPLIVYIGDDETDEDAFRSLRGKAITIKVGEPKSSAAEYYLRDVQQVHELLSRIAELKRKQ
jgi:trehalose-phosphatase